MKSYLSIYYELRNEIPFADEIDLRRVAYGRWKGLDVDKSRNVPSPKRREPRIKSKNKLEDKYIRDNLTPYEKRNRRNLRRSERSSYLRHLQKRKSGRCWVKRIISTPM